MQHRFLFNIRQIVIVESMGRILSIQQQCYATFNQKSGYLSSITSLFNSQYNWLHRVDQCSNCNLVSSSDYTQLYCCMLLSLLYNIMHCNCIPPSACFLYRLSKKLKCSCLQLASAMDADNRDHLCKIPACMLHNVHYCSTRWPKVESRSVSRSNHFAHKHIHVMYYLPYLLCILQPFATTQRQSGETGSPEGEPWTEMTSLNSARQTF